MIKFSHDDQFTGQNFLNNLLCVTHYFSKIKHTMANNFDVIDTFLDLLDFEDNIDNVRSEAKKPGRKKNEVWNYFIEDENRKGGHSSSKCVYCGDTRDRGRVPDLISHLALQCES